MTSLEATLSVMAESEEALRQQLARTHAERQAERDKAQERLRALQGELCVLHDSPRAERFRE